jgi:hypothetical protein
MNPCSGASAFDQALAYIEGSLPEFEAERFEEHYFDCPVCLRNIQVLQAVGRALAREASIELAPTGRKRPLAWPNRIWVLGAAAAIVVIGIVGFRLLSDHQQAGPSQAHNAPVPPPQTTPSPVPASSISSAGAATQLADLALPTFAPPNLRGTNVDAHFEEGMVAYNHGKCQAAISSLAKVPAGVTESRPAVFCTAACQMHMGELQPAAAGFQKVVDQGESLQQESAIYYLAQIALAENNPDEAHHFLLKTIAIRGDLEHRARTQDKKVLALIETEGNAETSRPVKK